MCSLAHTGFAGKYYSVASIIFQELQAVCLYGDLEPPTQAPNHVASVSATLKSPRSPAVISKAAPFKRDAMVLYCAPFQSAQPFEGDADCLSSRDYGRPLGEIASVSGPALNLINVIRNTAK